MIIATQMRWILGSVPCKQLRVDSSDSSSVLWFPESSHTILAQAAQVLPYLIFVVSYLACSGCHNKN